MTLTSRWRSWSSSVGDMSRGRIWLKRGPAPNSRALSVICRSAACKRPKEGRLSLGNCKSLMHIYEQSHSMFLAEAHTPEQPIAYYRVSVWRSKRDTDLSHRGCAVLDLQQELHDLPLLLLFGAQRGLVHLHLSQATMPIKTSQRHK